MRFAAVVAMSLVSAQALGAESDQPISVVGLKARRADAEMIQAVEEVWTKHFPPGFRAEKAGPRSKAEISIRGEVLRLGVTYYVKVELLDAAGSVEASAEDSCAAQEEPLVEALDRATRRVLRSPQPAQSSAPASDKPVATQAAPPKLVPPAARTELTYVKVENQNRKRALYACLGGAVLATSGMLALAVTEGRGDGAWLGTSALLTGAAAFVVGGAAYVVSPSHHTKAVAVPVADGKQAGVAMAGKF